MTTAEHLGFGLGLLCAASGIWAAHGLWQDRTSQFDEMWATWPLGERSWRGFVRAFPTLMVGNFVSVAFAWPLVALEGGRGPGGRAAGVFALLTAAAFLLTFGVAALIMVTGRPARLVPPHLRERDDERDRDRPRRSPPPAASERTGRRPPRHNGDSPGRRYRDGRLTLVMMSPALAVMAGAALMAFGLLDLPPLAAGIATALFGLWVAHAVRRLVRLAVVTDRHGVTVRNTAETVTVPWQEVDRIVWHVPNPRRRPLARLYTRSGDEIALQAIEGPEMEFRWHRRWAQQAMDDIQDELEAARDRAHAELVARRAQDPAGRSTG